MQAEVALKRRDIEAGETRGHLESLCPTRTRRSYSGPSLQSQWGEEYLVQKLVEPVAVTCCIGRCLYER